MLAGLTIANNVKMYRNVFGVMTLMAMMTIL